jgi:hypothetical protein
MTKNTKRGYYQTADCGCGRKKEKRRKFYYLHCLKTDKMLCLSDTGDWEWRDHDTIHDTPHLFSTPLSARQCAYQTKRGTLTTYRWKR